MEAGLAAVPQQGPETGTKRSKMTQAEMIVDAITRIDEAVAELDTAVLVGLKVPGFNVAENLIPKLEPVIAKCGRSVRLGKAAKR